MLLINDIYLYIYMAVYFILYLCSKSLFIHVFHTVYQYCLKVFSNDYTFRIFEQIRCVVLNLILHAVCTVNVGLLLAKELVSLYFIAFQCNSDLILTELRIVLIIMRILKLLLFVISGRCSVARVWVCIVWHICVVWHVCRSVRSVVLV